MNVVTGLHDRIPILPGYKYHRIYEQLTGSVYMGMYNTFNRKCLSACVPKLAVSYQSEKVFSLKMVQGL